MHPNEETTPAPKFATVVRGYDRMQVDDYVEHLTQWIEQADYRAQQCEAAVTRANAEIEQLRRRLASVDSGTLTATPESMKALGDRVGNIMQSSFDAAKELHRRAEDTAQAVTAAAEEAAASIIEEATARAGELSQAAEDLFVQSQGAIEGANAAAAREMKEAQALAAAKRDELFKAAQGEARELARRAAEEHQVRREQLRLLEEHRRRVLEEIGILHQRLGSIGDGLTAPAPAPPKPAPAPPPPAPSPPAPAPPQPAPAPPQHASADETTPGDDETLVLEMPAGAKSKPTRRKVASSSSR